jgi:hypothetical protein
VVEARRAALRAVRSLLAMGEDGADVERALRAVEMAAARGRR